ncbi:MAG: MarR family transcriptional regulator [Pseudomonadota bacterium]
MLETLFFAYRDFTSDPDKMLDHIGFGRAHHRVLFFVNRQPGLTVAEMLDILKITKQSLARVLKQLIDTDHVYQIEGEADRRKRLLYPTPKGRKLILELSSPQSRRIEKAVAGFTREERKSVLEFLVKMTDGQ